VNPILVELTRGKLIESVHRGAIAIARPSGELYLALGETSQPVFPRSSVKALQAIPLIESGAADCFAFGAQELALACASHSGTRRHTMLVADMLRRVGLTHCALSCGAHMPTDDNAAHELIAIGATPSSLHNNCSGKHAGMLATAKHCGDPLQGYWQPEHPVQARILTVLRDLTGSALSPDVRAIDGCSIPTWAIALRNLAQAFARFATGEGMGTARAAVCQRIAEACWSEPDLVAGPGRLDTLALKQLKGRMFLKTGAEGIYCGALPLLGLGFALKIDDGAKRASEVVVAAMIDRLFTDARGLGPARHLENWRELIVGEARIPDALERALDKLPA
jgi:L-asparaginase II